MSLSDEWWVSERGCTFVCMCGGVWAWGDQTFAHGNGCLDNVKVLQEGVTDGVGHGHTATSQFVSLGECAGAL